MSEKTDKTDSLVLGLQVLTTLVRRGPLDTARLARLNGWRQSDAAAVVDLLEQEGLIRQVGEPAQLTVTSRAIALLGEVPLAPTVH
ncbi:MAG TPA: hypothetical protein VF592_06430 [Sphingomonas sp.]|jgi:DNA-binding MarR family transcriptional regulator|uniref:hypothetical protein n=1 Tax=Sphingomonas sp. TaxID=28214 RepID=UPI002EDAC5D6